MKKIDYRKELRSLYAPLSKEISIVDVPIMNYIMIDGKGDPNKVNEYSLAIEALYTVSYTIKFMIKKGEMGIDYGVLPLEGLWWVPNMEEFSPLRKDDWLWTAMIMQPDMITKEIFHEAIESVRKKKNLAAIEKIRFESYSEGKCAQILYFGPYSGEAPTIARLHNVITEREYKRTGKHHEIYLNDPRKTAPEKLKTIIRQPMK